MDADALSARFMDLNRLGIPRQPRSLMPITDEQVYKFDPDRYSFYMHLLQALSDPNSSLLKDVFGVVNRTRRTRERIDEATQHVVNDLLYLTKNPMDGAQVGGGLSDSEGIGSAISQGLNTLGNGSSGSQLGTLVDSAKGALGNGSQLGDLVSNATGALGNGSDIMNSATGALGNGQLGDIVGSATDALGNGNKLIDIVGSATDALGNGNRLSDIVGSATDALGSGEDPSQMLQGSLTKIGSITPDLANLAAQHGIDVSGMQLPQQLASRTPDTQPPQPNEDLAEEENQPIMALPSDEPQPEQPKELLGPSTDNDTHTGLEHSDDANITNDTSQQDLQNDGMSANPMEVEVQSADEVLSDNAVPSAKSVASTPSIIEQALDNPQLAQQVSEKLADVSAATSTDDMIAALQNTLDLIPSQSGGVDVEEVSTEPLTGMYQMRQVLLMMKQMLEDAKKTNIKVELTKQAVHAYIQYLRNSIITNGKVPTNGKVLEPLDVNLLDDVLRDIPGINSCLEYLRKMFENNNAVYWLAIYKYLEQQFPDAAKKLDPQNARKHLPKITFALDPNQTINMIRQSIDTFYKGVLNLNNEDLLPLEENPEVAFYMCVLPGVLRFLNTDPQNVYCAVVMLTDLLSAPNVDGEDKAKIKEWIRQLNDLFINPPSNPAPGSVPTQPSDPASKSVPTPKPAMEQYPFFDVATVDTALDALLQKQRRFFGLFHGGSDDINRLNNLLTKVNDKNAELDLQEYAMLAGALTNYINNRSNPSYLAKVKYAKSLLLRAKTKLVVPEAFVDAIRAVIDIDDEYAYNTLYKVGSSNYDPAPLGTYISDSKLPNKPDANIDLILIHAYPTLWNQLSNGVVNVASTTANGASKVANVALHGTSTLGENAANLLARKLKSANTPDPNPTAESESTPNETSLPNRASAFLANLFQKSDSEEEPPCNDEPVDVGISVDPAELTAAVQQIDPNLVVVDGTSQTQEPQGGGAFAAREDLLRMLGGAWDAHGTQSGGGFYDRILGQLNLAETQPPEMRRRLENYILNQYENDPVYSPAAAAVTTTDRLIFITLTFVLRAVALFLLEWGLQANYITSFNNAFFLYIGVYLSLFALMALLVNASDKVLSLHMLFYYLSLHSGDGRGLIRMFLHVFIIMLLLPVPLLLRRRNANGTTMDEYERNRQISTTMGQFTLFVWIATSALALRF